MKDSGRAIQKVYDDAIKRIQKLYHLSKRDAEVFYFKKNPALLKKLETELSQFSSELTTAIELGATQAWISASMHEEGMIISRLGNKAKVFSNPVDYYRNNASTYMKKINKRLSSRVWQMTEQFKEEIELTLQLGINKGASAAQISADLKKYLNAPETLFRRVRDEFGNLHLSKAAKSYTPGRGIYRSSHKNAMRLARTEINIAYERAAYEQRLNNPLVRGVEISLSNNHPVTDICDTLAGMYPKEFVFTKWHPQCRCMSTSILITEDEMDAWIDAPLDSDGSDIKSVNDVTDVPDNYTKWCTDNKDRIAKAEKKGTLPYFVMDNKNYTPKGILKNKLTPAMT